MGVDTSVSVGVGFIITAEQMQGFRATIPDEDNYGDDEILEKVPFPEGKLLGFGTGGSYYDSEPFTHWICVNRLTTSHDTDSIPGGVIGLSRPVVTLAERQALNEVAAVFGIENPEVGQFISVLWY